MYNLYFEQLKMETIKIKDILPLKVLNTYPFQLFVHRTPIRNLFHSRHCLNPRCTKEQFQYLKLLESHQLTLLVLLLSHLQLLDWAQSLKTRHANFHQVENRVQTARRFVERGQVKGRRDVPGVVLPFLLLV